MKPKDKLVKDRGSQLAVVKAKFIRFRVIIFVVFVALVYAYVFLQINSFVNAKPNPLLLSSQTQSSTSIPRIDPATVNKIKQLKDNSVNVQGLFNKARNNPFAGD